jgi:hypothetical protein
MLYINHNITIFGLFIWEISNVELGTKNSVLEKGIAYARRKKRIGYGILYCVMIMVRKTKRKKGKMINSGLLIITEKTNDCST